MNFAAYDKTAQKPRWKLDVRSFVLGLVLAAAPLVGMGTAGAFDLNSVGNIGKAVAVSVKSLFSIKKNLDTDVKNLSADAKALFADKDKLFAIKNQLSALANETRAQIDSVSKLVSEVESHIKTTQTNIQSTSNHVGEIDEVRKSLQGK